jgi:hypothetical protein
MAGYTARPDKPLSLITISTSEPNGIAYPSGIGIVIPWLCHHPQLKEMKNKKVIFSFNPF